MWSNAIYLVLLVKIDIIFYFLSFYDKIELLRKKKDLIIYLQFLRFSAKLLFLKSSKPYSGKFLDK